MQFGKVDIHTLNVLNLDLPADHGGTRRVLAAHKTNAPVEVRVGCTGWGLAEWVGKIYPKGTKPASFLDAYAKQFNTIEFNGTWYKLPTKEQVAVWKQKAGEGFKFCPKFTDVITHTKQLKNVEAELAAFVDVCEAFGENLGPLFLMPHPQMGPRELKTILAFIDQLPRELNVFTEFRHNDCFRSPGFESVFDALEEKKYGVVITDTVGRRDCVHMRLTVPEVFIRFVGNSLHPTDYSRIDQWVQRLKVWIGQGLQKCYFFMHQHEEVHAPELCKYFIEQMNEKCGTKMKVPRFMEETDLRLF